MNVGPVRMPLCEMGAQNAEILAAMLKKYGLMK